MQKDLYRFGIVRDSRKFPRSSEIAGKILYTRISFFVGILLLLIGAVFYLLNIRWQAGHAAL